MKQINLHGITQMQPLGGTDSWYFVTDYTSGDLYEAEELYRNGHEVKSNHLYLIHYPDGTVIEPILPEVHCYFGLPIFYENAIYILSVDFGKQQIRIHRFDGSANTVTEVRCFPLNKVEDCYNLMLHKSPLMLTRQSAENRFEIIWPEQVEFVIHPRESFVFREDEKLYFSLWHEDPEYREEIVVRSLMDGQIIEKYDGSIMEMPNGEWWHLK